MWYFIGFGVTALVVLLMWLAYLIFCGWLVKQSKDKDTKCLHDAAVAARAFPGAGIAGAIARAFRPDPVVEVVEAVRGSVQGSDPAPLEAQAGSGSPAP